MLKARLNIQKIKRVKDRGSTGLWRRTIDAAKNAGYDGIVYLNRHEGIPMGKNDVCNRVERAGYSSEVVNKCLRSIYRPGWLNTISDEEFKHLYPEAEDSYIVFYPDQIMYPDRLSNPTIGPVYHGTPAKLKDASELYLGNDMGIHFGTKKQAILAAHAALRNREDEYYKVLPAYLSIDKLKRLTDQGTTRDWREALNTVQSQGYDGVVYLNRYEGVPNSPRSIERRARKAGFPSDITDWLHEMAGGYEGERSNIYNWLLRLSDEEFKKLFPEARDSYIVFDTGKIRPEHNPVAMVTLYHASPRLPTKGSWRKGTYFATTADSAMYYAESHHRGKIFVREVRIPAAILEKQGGHIYRLKKEYPISSMRGTGIANPTATINWNLTDTGMSYYNQIFTHPEYMAKNKGVVGEIIWVTPERYFELAAESHSYRGHIVPVANEYKSILQKNVEKLAAMMRDGVAIDLLVIEISERYSNQEGRHRVLAAASLGAKKVPVLMVTDSVTKNIGSVKV
jgi:hypothetical protein